MFLTVFVYVLFLESEPGVSCLLGEDSTTELLSHTNPSPLFFAFKYTDRVSLYFLKLTL